MKLRQHLAGFEVADDRPAVAEPGALPYAEDLLSQDPLMQAHRRNVRRRMSRDATQRRN